VEEGNKTIPMPTTQHNIGAVLTNEIDEWTCKETTLNVNIKIISQIKPPKRETSDSGSRSQSGFSARKLPLPIAPTA
jgi:hypothetical protein